MELCAQNIKFYTNHLQQCGYIFDIFWHILRPLCCQWLVRFSVNFGVFCPQDFAGTFGPQLNNQEQYNFAKKCQKPSSWLVQVGVRLCLPTANNQNGSKLPQKCSKNPPHRCQWLLTGTEIPTSTIKKLGKVMMLLLLIGK